MMRGLTSTMEKHHKVQVLDEALEASVRLSHPLHPGAAVPDKSVSLLDTACARVAISQHAVPPEVDDTRKRIEALENELAIIGRETAVGVEYAEREGGAREARHGEAEARGARGALETRESAGREDPRHPRQVARRSGKVEGTASALEAARCRARKARQAADGRNRRCSDAESRAKSARELARAAGAAAQAAG
jgi:type VI secretion system protein VasG